VNSNFGHTLLKPVSGSRAVFRRLVAALALGALHFSFGTVFWAAYILLPVGGFSEASAELVYRVRDCAKGTEPQNPRPHLKTCEWLSRAKIAALAPGCRGATKRMLPVCN